MEVDAAPARNHGGRVQGLPSYTQQRKYERLRQSVKASRSEYPYLTHETSFSVTHGTIALVQPKNCTTILSHAEFLFGLAKKMLFLAPRLCAKSTGD